MGTFFATLVALLFGGVLAAIAICGAFAALCAFVMQVLWWCDAGSER